VTDPTPTRPRQVTMAAWLILVGSAVVVVLVFDRLAGLHTLETRQSVEAFLSEPPGSDLDLGVGGVLSLIRTVGMIAAGCATAAGILGYQVLRRSRSARVALTVLAVPLFLTGLVTGGFVPAVVAGSAVMLWLQPSRDWFAGRSGPDVVPASVAASPAAPVAVVPAAAFAPTTHHDVPAGGWQAPSADAPAVRPPAVLGACVLTWVFSALTALAVVLSAVALLLDPDVMLDEVHRQNPDLAAQGVTDAMLTTVTFVLIGGVVLWCAAAAVLAVLTVRRVAWARTVLIASASVAALLCLAGSALGAFLLALPLAGSVLSLALLVRADARAWFDAP
jgi:hypothetical protein